MTKLKGTVYGEFTIDEWKRIEARRMVEKLISFILFQIAWCAAVLGGAHHVDFVGACPALALFALHIMRHHRRWAASLVTIVSIVVMGVVIELLLLKSGVIVYSGLTASATFPPVWILALWLAFATLPEDALSWLSGRLGLQIIFGALGGPLSYLAGERLGAATLHGNFIFAVATLALLWAIATPLCFVIVRFFSDKSADAKAA